MKTKVAIGVPAGFDFQTTVESHGWCELAPFSLDQQRRVLRYVFADEAGAVEAEISPCSDGLAIELDRPSSRIDDFAAAVKHMLRLNEDFLEFYSAIACDERLVWIAEGSAGRLLRSPTVWEDLVKTLCTTNCSWALTKIMVRNLVEKLGAATDGSGFAFPTPAAMASVDEDFYRTEIRAGYRSPFFVELAQKVASGELDPEAWLTSGLPTPELKKEMKKVKGVGDYAAENLLKLVGHYDGLALDSWLRSQFYKNHNAQEKCDDGRIVEHYAKFGRWRGLAIWCDLSEKWIRGTARAADIPEAGGRD